jgi:hypothetical protein
VTEVAVMEVAEAARPTMREVAERTRRAIALAIALGYAPALLLNLLLRH